MHSLHSVPVSSSLSLAHQTLIPPVLLWLLSIFCCFSLFVFCLVASLLLISSLSVSKHPKAHSAGGTIRSTRVDNRMNDVAQIIKKKLFEVGIQTLNNDIFSHSDVTLHLHATQQTFFYLIAGRWQRRWLLCLG